MNEGGLVTGLTVAIVSNTKNVIRSKLFKSFLTHNLDGMTRQTQTGIGITIKAVADAVTPEKENTPAKKKNRIFTLTSKRKPKLKASPTSTSMETNFFGTDSNGLVRSRD